MGQAILIRSARQLLTLRGAGGPRRREALKELSIIPDGALLLADGVIQEVGPTSRVVNVKGARDAIEINATGKVVMPGFVDCHTHLMFPPPPPAGSDPPIDNERAARSLLAATAQRLAGRGRTYLEIMARHGTTTLEAKSGCGPDERAELKVLRVLKAINKRPLDIIPTFLFRLASPHTGIPREENEANELVLRDLMFKIRRRRLARFADLQWDSDGVRRPLLVRFLEAAQSLGFACKIHADQSSALAVALAVQYGATSIDHLEHATLDQARLLAGSSTIAVLLPCASFLRGDFAPARVLIEFGGAVALGSNFNPSLSPPLNMQTAIALACLQMAMTPAEAVAAATINAAHALRLQAQVGSLESGKKADVIILDTSDYRDMAYQLGTNLVTTTIKSGTIL